MSRGARVQWFGVKAVLFDAAGTLFRVRGSVGEAYAAVAARHG